MNKLRIVRSERRARLRPPVEVGITGTLVCQFRALMAARIRSTESTAFSAGRLVWSISGSPARGFIVQCRREQRVSNVRTLFRFSQLRARMPIGITPWPRLLGAPGRVKLVQQLCKYMILKWLVALTGIEWVSRQFSSVQFSLSCFVSVLPVQQESVSGPYKTLWCDPRVTATRGFFGCAEILQ